MGKQLRSVSLALVAVLALAALAACGGDDEDESIIGGVATRMPAEGAPTEMPTPDEAALTAEAATAVAERTAQASGEDDGDAVATTFRLEGYDIGWRTADQDGPQVELTVPPGATIELPNVGAAPHNFSVDAHNNAGVPDLGIDVDMPVGETVTAQIPADAPPGTYYFYCDVPGHEAAGMHGTLVIDPNAAPPGAAASPAATPAATPAAGTPAPEGDEEAAVTGPVALEGYDIGWRTAEQDGPQVELRVAAGATIELPNVGAAPHNFSVDAKNNEGLPDLGIDVDMPVGETATAEIPADAPPGTYYFYCDVPGHEAAGMHGTLVIE